MEHLIDVVNDLHDAFTNVKMNIKLNLPQIAVVGSQSSGKSSVLEAIVGKDFLPRGSGIVTRCPLVLQLVQLGKGSAEEWGEFLHRPGKKYFDFSDINKEIQNRTEELAGRNGITEKAINLKVFSSHVLNLTLVDLPGLVMNAVGDQPKDIDRQIKDMVMRYVSPVNTIILAISPANTDLATSASLRMAKQLDPEGVRTVGVLTKLDLMDRGTDAFDILTGKVMNLRHGFIGVVNRSQQDINEAKDMLAAREDERLYFENHPVYSAIAETQGTEYLAKKLNYLLLDHIKEVIPELKTYVDKLVDSTRKQMEKLGMLNQGGIDPTANMLSLIKLFSDTLNHTIDGGMADASKELLGGARLDYIFHECFSSYVNSLSSIKDLTDEYILINTRNMAGMHASLFPSDQVFVALAKQQIGRLEEPSLKCVQFVYEELVRIIEICAEKLDRFPKLRQAVVSLCQRSLEEYRQPTSSHVRTIIAAERGFINVKHPMMEKLVQRALSNIFGTNKEKQNQSSAQQHQGDGHEKGKKGAAESGSEHGERPNASLHASNMGNVPTKIMPGSNMSVHEKHVNDTIREMVEGYFNVVKGNVADQVPKAITLLMITKLREEVYAKLVREFYSDKVLDNLLVESPEVETQRKATMTMMTALTKAQAALDRVRDFTMSSSISYCSQRSSLSMWSLFLTCVAVIVTGVKAIDMCPENGSLHLIAPGGTAYGHISSPTNSECVRGAAASIVVLLQPPPRSLLLPTGGWQYLFGAVVDEKLPVTLNFTLSARCGGVEVCRATIYYIVDPNALANESSTHDYPTTSDTHSHTTPLKYPPCAASTAEYELVVTPGKAHFATLPTTALQLVCPTGYNVSISQPEVGSAALLAPNSLRFVYSLLNMNKEVNVTIPYEVACDSEVMCGGEMMIRVHDSVPPCSKSPWVYDVKPGEELNRTLNINASCNGLAEWRVRSKNFPGSLEFRGGGSFTFSAPEEEMDVVVKARFFCDDEGICDTVMGFIVTNQVQPPSSGTTGSPSISDVALCEQQFNFTVPTGTLLRERLQVTLDGCDVITYHQPSLALEKNLRLNIIGDFLYVAPLGETVEVLPVDVLCAMTFKCRTHITITSYHEVAIPEPPTEPSATDAPVSSCSKVYYYQTPPGVALSNSLNNMPGQDPCAHGRYFSIIDPPKEGTLDLVADGDFLFRPPAREGPCSFSFSMYCLNKLYCKGNAYILVSKEVTISPDITENESHSSSQPTIELTNPQIKCRGTCNERAWKTYPDVAMWDNTAGTGYARGDGHPVGGIHVSSANGSIIVTVYTIVGNLGLRFPTFEPIKHVEGKYFEPKDFENVVQPSSLGFELSCLANQGTIGVGGDVWQWKTLDNGTGTGSVGVLYKSGVSWYQKFGGKHIECDTFADSCHYAPLLTPATSKAADTIGGWEVEIDDCDATWTGTFPYASLQRLKKSDGSPIWHFLGDKQIKATVISESVRASSWSDPTRGFDHQYEAHDVIFNLEQFVVVNKKTAALFSIDPEFFEYKKNGDRAFGVNLLLYPHVTHEMETSYSEDRHVVGFKWVTQDWSNPGAEQCPTCQGTKMHCTTKGEHAISTYIGEFPSGDCPPGKGRIELQKGPAMDTTCLPNRMHVYNRSGFSTPSSCATSYQNLTIRGISIGSAALSDAVQRAFNYEGRVLLELMMADGTMHEVVLELSMYMARLSQDSFAAEGGLSVCRGSDYWPVLDPLGTSLPDSPFLLGTVTPRPLCIDLLSSTFGPSGWATVFLQLPGITPSQVHVHSIFLSYNGTNVYLLYEDQVTGVARIPPRNIGYWWKHTHPFLSFRDITKRVTNGTITVGEAVRQEEVANVSFAFAFIPGSINLATNVEVVMMATITTDKVSTSTFRRMLHVDPMLTQRSRYGPPRKASEMQELDKKNAIGVGAIVVVVVAVFITAVAYMTMDNNRPLPQWVPRGKLIKSTVLAALPAGLRPTKKRSTIVHRDMYDAMKSGSY